MMSENSRHATMDAGVKPNKSEGLKCYPCSLEKVQNDVNCFCIQCVEHLCSNCAKDHRKIKLTRCHVLLEGDEMPTDASAFEEMAKLTFCKMHAGREIEFKCGSHNEFICSICFRETHRICDNVASVNDCVPDKESFKSAYYEKHLALKSSLDKQLENVSEHKDTTQIFGQIKSLSDELQNLIVQLHELDTDKLKTETDRITENILKLNEFLGELNSNMELVDAVVKHGSDAQLAILSHSANLSLDSIRRGVETLEKYEFDSAMKHIIHDFGELKENISRLKKNLSVSKLFTLNASTVKLATKDATCSRKSNKSPVPSDNHNIESLKDMDTFNPTRPTEDVLDVVRDLKREDVDISSESVQVSLFESTIRKDKSYDISIRKHSAKTSSNMAAVIFNNGYMVFTDYDNKVVKLVSDEFEVITYISLSNRPLDLSLIKDKLIVVAAGNSILIFSVCCSCFEIRQMREFKTKEFPYSVTAIGNALAILNPESEDGNIDAFVQIRSMENKILENVNNFVDTRNSKTRMNNPRTIRRTMNDNFLIGEVGRVSIYDRQGKMKCCFEPGYFTRLCFLAFDTENNIYVCDADVDKVYQISADFSKCRTLISDSLSPSCVVCNPAKKLIVVGCFNDNCVHTYKFG